VRGLYLSSNRPVRPALRALCGVGPAAGLRGPCGLHCGPCVPYVGHVATTIVAVGPYMSRKAKLVGG